MTTNTINSTDEYNDEKQRVLRADTHAEAYERAKNIGDTAGETMKETAEVTSSLIVAWQREHIDDITIK
jgi:hypothetical protein